MDLKQETKGGITIEPVTPDCPIALVWHAWDKHWHVTIGGYIVGWVTPQRIQLAKHWLAVSEIRLFIGEDLNNANLQEVK
jgi:hypothetical protein